MIRRLKIKFVCINMLIVTLMLVVIFGWVLHNTSQDIEMQGRRTLENILEFSHGRGPGRGPVRESYFVYVISEQGKADLYTHGAFDDYSEAELSEICRQVYDSGDKNGFLMEHSLRFARRMTHRGEAIAFIDISMAGNIIKGLIKNSIKIFLVSFALFLGISILLAQWAVRPVDTAWKHQRQFVADASHELKTPLTVIMTNAEILQDGNMDSPSEQFVQNILFMSQQMRGLVEGLLNLARVDNGVIETTFSDVDFSTVVNHSLLPFEPVFFEKGMALEAEVSSNLFLHGSEPHLRQVVDILLDNAAKYGHADRAVSVLLRRQGRYALLCVSTAGDPISSQDLKNIFKRFYQIDKARSMNHSYGLGLSIAENIVTHHKGKIWAESRNGTNSFYVQIPSMSGKAETEK